MQLILKRGFHVYPHNVHSSYLIFSHYIEISFHIFLHRIYHQSSLWLSRLLLLQTSVSTETWAHRSSSSEVWAYPGFSSMPCEMCGRKYRTTGVQSTVDIPQWEGQIRFQDCLNGKDRVGPHNHVNLHKWWGDIRKVANKKATTAAPEKQNRESVDNSTFWNDF